MKITFRTYVQQDFRKVYEGFNEKLFVALAPFFPKIRLLQFDGNQTGNEVHLELHFLFFKQTWQSLITQNEIAQDRIFFTDEGMKLPFFLKFWKHYHRIVKAPQGGSFIEDEINYKTPFFLFDYLIYPLMWLQFAYRKPIYKRKFS